MPFTSLKFALFFCAFYALYAALRKNVRIQNGLLLVASYLFYSQASPKFLAVLLFYTTFNYFLGISLESRRDTRAATILLAVGILVDIGLLAIFKYGGAFSGGIVVPLGISFFTFRTLGYLFDVHAGAVPAARDFLEFGIYTAFFPSLIAGPIDRAGSFLPQVSAPRRLNAGRIDEGVYLVLFGLFQKVVIADQLARIADPAFSDPSGQAGFDLWLGLFAYTGQIFCDFSGYTDIARGLGKLMGFNLALNFNLPYFSVNPTDFWSRWHMSLSSWFHDYFYMPLGLRSFRIHPWLGKAALWATMVLIGLWHGPSWTFVAFGAYHGVLVLAHNAWPKRKKAQVEAAWVPWAKRVAMMAAIMGGWILFRSETLADAAAFVRHLSLERSGQSLILLPQLILLLSPIAFIQWIQFRGADLLAVQRAPLVWRIPAYALFILGLIAFGGERSIEFIYFRF